MAFRVDRAHSSKAHTAMSVMFALALVSGGFVAGILVDRSTALAGASAGEPADVAGTFGVFWQAWDLAERHYVERPSLDVTKMTYGAVEGMLDALGDQGHTRFLTPDDVRSERDALSGTLVGVGVEVSVQEGHPVVVAPIDGSPAQQAGVRAGDAIIAVDGHDVEGLSISEVVRLVRGPAGVPVTLTVMHQGEAAPVDIPIVRATITVPSVSWVLVPGTQTAQLLVSQFSEHTADNLGQALSAARAAGATSLILDLRNDPGGIRDEAIGVASQFLSDGDVLIERDAQGEQHAYHVTPGGAAVDLPLVVLVNQGTASSGEIVAGALQDHQRGPVVGATTFGTGTVLSMYNLSDGSAIFLGTAEWLTPNGRQIWHHGVAPDEPVPLASSAHPLTPNEVRSFSAEQVASSQDAQLLRALHDLQQTPTAS